MPGPAHALQEGHDRARRPELTHQVDLADVDAQLQRCGGHDDPQGAALQALLGVQAPLARQTAVMGGHLFLAERGAEGVAHALGQAAVVDEHQRGAVLQNQLGEALVEFVPHFVRHHRFQRRAGQLQANVHGAPVAGVDDAALREMVTGAAAITGAAGQEGGGRLDGTLGGGQADARHRRRGEGIEPFQAQRQVGAALGAEDGVDLIHNRGARGGQQGAPAGAGQQQVE